MSRLYIMQNHVGLIKIGRTGQNVEARRRAIERDDACTIKIVAVIEDGGDFEEIMLANLDEHQVIGEWYDGSEMCRIDLASEVRALCEALTCDAPTLDWPYNLANQETTENWLVECEQRRIAASVVRQYSRVIGRLKNWNSEQIDELRCRDTEIWTTLYRFERQAGTMALNDTTSAGERILIGHYSNGPASGMVIPNYVDDVAAALSLFPTPTRPIAWDGSILDCCIAAIEARRTFINENGLAALLRDAEK